MALRVFETDEDARPRKRNTFADDLVGRFRSGRLVGRRPEALSEWRVTTDDEDVADSIASRYGGEPGEWDNEKEPFEVYTDAKSVDIIIDGPKSLTSRMALYGQAGPIHVCDGAFFVDSHPEAELVGDACGCPRKLSDRKDKAKTGTGPKPDIKLVFRLADDEDLGKFLFSSGSWSLVNDLEELEKALATGEGPYRAKLAIEYVEYKTKAGKEVSYHRPAIHIGD
jgi:hypothetical protein